MNVNIFVQEFDVKKDTIKWRITLFLPGILAALVSSYLSWDLETELGRAGLRVLILVIYLGRAGLGVLWSL